MHERPRRLPPPPAHRRPGRAPRGARGVTDGLPQCRRRRGGGLPPTRPRGEDCSTASSTFRARASASCPAPPCNSLTLHTRNGRPRGEVYAGASALASPAPGFGVEVGQVFARPSYATWSFEVEAGWQDLGESFEGGTGSGQWGQVQGGAKASFLPCKRWHPTARAGLAWFRATEDTEFIDEAGDYVGVYAGLGLEYDVTAG